MPRRSTRAARPHFEVWGAGAIPQVHAAATHPHAAYLHERYGDAGCAVRAGFTLFLYNVVTCWPTASRAA